MNPRRFMLALLPAAFLAAPLASAEDATPPGIRGELIRSMADVADKSVSLAKAVPAKRYAWRPGKGVRSIGEVYVHIAASNYALPVYAGVPSPREVPRDAERRVTDKAEIVAMLEDSFAHLHRAIAETPDADLDRVVKTFLGEMSVRSLYLQAVAHGHEHLGQSIAYARTNDIVPPWTAAEQAKAKTSANEGAAKSHGH